jgi:hypothetical protein
MDPEFIYDVSSQESPFGLQSKNPRNRGGQERPRLIEFAFSRVYCPHSRVSGFQNTILLTDNPSSEYICLTILSTSIFLVQDQLFEDIKSVRFMFLVK